MTTTGERRNQAYGKLKRIYPAAYFDGCSLWRFVEVASLGGAQPRRLVLQELPGFTGWQRGAAVDRTGRRICPRHHWGFGMKGTDLLTLNPD